MAECFRLLFNGLLYLPASMQLVFAVLLFASAMVFAVALHRWLEARKVAKDADFWAAMPASVAVLLVVMWGTWATGSVCLAMSTDHPAVAAIPDNMPPLVVVAPAAPAIAPRTASPSGLAHASIPGDSKPLPTFEVPLHRAHPHTLAKAPAAKPDKRATPAVNAAASPAPAPASPAPAIAPLAPNAPPAKQRATGAEQPDGDASDSPLPPVDPEPETLAQKPAALEPAPRRSVDATAALRRMLATPPDAGMSAATATNSSPMNLAPRLAPDAPPAENADVQAARASAPASNDGFTRNASRMFARGFGALNRFRGGR